MKTSRFLATAVAGLAVVAALGACRDSRTSAASSSGAPQVKIMVGGLDKIIYLPAKLTEQLGYFKEEGVDVQLLTEPSGAQAENVLISGDVQGVVGFYDHAIDLQAKGKCIESVVQFANVPGEAEVVATGKAAQISSAKDFKGKRLGITSPGSEEGTRAALGGLYPASSLYMDCAWVKANKPTVQKIANALVRTLKFIDSHPAPEIAAKMPANYAGGDPQLYAKAVNDTKGIFNTDGVMPADGAKNVLDVLASFSPSVQGKKDSIDLSKTYTTEFVKAATAKS